jgi:hypothetical protein
MPPPYTDVAVYFVFCSFLRVVALFHLACHEASLGGVLAPGWNSIQRAALVNHGQVQPTMFSVTML